MIRFYVNPEAVSENDIKITGEALHYLRNVVRAEDGETLKVFDGTGREYICEVSMTRSGPVKLLVKRAGKADNELGIDVSMALGLAKPKSLEFSIQKATELGVGTIIPVVTARTPGYMREKAAGCSRRWARIAEEAARQSGRSVPPGVLMPPVGFDEALSLSSSSDIAVIPWEEEENQTLGAVFRGRGFDSLRSVFVFIGPEGGFSREEIARAGKAGVMPVSLGPRILRSETAAAAVMSMIVYNADL